MTEETEVRTKIKVDTNSAAAAAKLKGDLQSVDKHVQSTALRMGQSLGGGMKAGAVMMGTLYAQAAQVALNKGKELFTAPVEAFMESQKQVKALAGTFALLDKGGNSMGALKMFAAQTKDELEDLGMKIGVADDALVEVFNNIIERGGKSVEESKKLTESFAYAGRIVPGGAVAISESFEQIQMGIVRAKNPIVGMIAATGLLKGNAKHVAAEMQKMSPEKQMKLGELAVQKMADKMKNSPMTMKEAMTSMKVMGDNLLENMGESMTKGLSKAVLQVRGLFFEDNGEATKLTTSLMEGFKQAGEFLANAFTVIKPFAYGIVDGFMVMFKQTQMIWAQVMGDGVSSWETIRDIAGAVGKAIGFAINGLVAGVGVLVLSVQKMLKYMTIGIGMFLQGLADAAQISAKIQEMLGDKKGAAGMRSEARKLKEAGAQTMLFGTKAERGDSLSKAKQTGGGDEATLRAQFMESVTASGVKDNTAYIAQFDAALQERRAMEANVQIASSAVEMQNAQAYLAAFQTAANAHDTAAMQNIAKFLGNNEKMATAIGQLAPDIIAGGVKSFTDTLQSVGNTSMADIIAKLQGGKLKIGPSGGGNVNMSGGQTFNIKQDFRDQDPDRVAVIFRRDITRVAANRIQSRIAGPFGQ